MERNDLIDPDMSNQQMRLHFGEMTAQEMRTARAAIRFANSRASTTIASLSEALAEAEKKGAEDWRGMASAPRDASEIIVRMPKKGWPGYYRQIAHWAEGGGDDQPPFRGWFRFMADGYVELPVEPTGWMPLATPRDLAQGGQHG